MDFRFRNARLQRQPTHHLAYTPYGFNGLSKDLLLVGFVGQWHDAMISCYPLGNGRRMYSSLLSRFYSPDVLSPFGRGGINAYAYCAGDPVNYVDPSGLNRYSAGTYSLNNQLMPKARFTKSLRPQVERFRRVAKAMGKGASSEVAVATLYKRHNPHAAYSRWELTYSFDNDEFSARFVYGNAICHLPAGKYAVTGDVFISGVGKFRPSPDIKGYKSYEVRPEDLKRPDWPAAQHDRPQLAESAWSEVAKAMWDVRFQRVIDQFDEMLDPYLSNIPPSPPPRRR